MRSRTDVRAIAPLDDLGLWARSDLLVIVLTLLGALLLGRLVAWTGHRITNRIDATSMEGDALVRSEQAKHRHSVTQVLTWVITVLIWCVTAVVIMQRLGLPLNGLVAPATVVGVALGFGAQRVVQDILAGFFLIAERQYGFGDVIRISALGSTAGVTGTVEDVTLRVTQLRSANGEVVIVPNGQIVQVTNLSRDWARAVVDVPLAATVDIARVNDVLHQVCEDAYADPDLRRLLLDMPSVMGLESLELGVVHIRVVARTLPGRQFEINRELRVRVALALHRAGISMAADAVANEEGS
jgi:small conductance mechanosensitive channel